MKHLLLIITLLCAGCKTNTDPIIMRIIDKDTGQPIKGAVAVYDLSASFSHGNDIYQLGLTETVSDDMGYIRFPSYEVPYRYLTQEFALDDPELTIFKRGYYPVFLNNNDHFRHDYTKTIWDHNNTDITLEKAADLNQYAKHVFKINGVLQRFYDYPSKNKCGWNITPHSIMTLMNEEVFLFTKHNIKSKYGVGSTYYGLWLNDKWFVENGCNNPIEFLNKFPILCPDNKTHMKNIKRKKRSINTSTYFNTSGYCENDKKNWAFTPRKGWQENKNGNLDNVH